MAPAPALTVETFSPSSTPAELFARLNAHLPFSLPVLRRLQFASRKSGAVATAHSHIIYVHAGAAFPAHFAAAFVDLSRGPETECWIYSTLQDSVAPNPDPTSSAALPPAADLARGAADACACQVLALLGRVRAIESDYSAAAVAGANEVRDGLNEAHSRGHARVGALHETVRRALLAAGVRVRATGVVPAGRGWDFYATWLLRVPGDLKGGTGDDDGSDCCRLPPGCCWDVLREGDTGLVKSRTKIPKREYVLIPLPPQSYRGAPVGRVLCTELESFWSLGLTGGN